MAQEIEKKFLVKGDFKADAFKATRITQGYLCSVPERTVRVRVKGDKGFITINVGRTATIAGIGIAYLYAVGMHTDKDVICFGNNDGLTVAEVELADEDEPFDKPAWLGEEVTGDPKYFNSMLMKNPYKNWK